MRKRPGVWAGGRQERGLNQTEKRARPPMGTDANVLVKPGMQRATVEESDEIE